MTGVPPISSGVSRLKTPIMAARAPTVVRLPMRAAIQPEPMVAMMPTKPPSTCTVSTSAVVWLPWKAIQESGKMVTTWNSA